MKSKGCSQIPVALASAAGRQLQKRPTKAGGMGLWGYVFTLALVAIVITLALRLGPHYLNQNTVLSIVESLKSESVHNLEKRKIRELLQKRFKINALYDLDPTKVIQIDRNKERTALQVKYEVREPLVYNVDAVLVFDDEFQFR